MSITSNQISTDITLDVSGKSSLSNISANQGNIKSHFVKAKLRDDTQAYIPPSTATGLVSFLTPNNTKVYEDVVSISGDTVTFELTESMLGTAGMGLCDISIIDNGSVLMSATVKVSIKPKAVPNDDDIVKDSDEYNVLVNALATAQEGETVRDNAESLRKSNESTRQTNEINRQQNLTTAIEAIIRADNATDNANSATDRANSATDRADDAADRANTSADRADDATSRANTAIATTEAATQKANNATDNAIDTATNLETTYSPRLGDLESDYNTHINNESPHRYGSRFEWKYNASNDSLDLVVIE
ncbi:MAG TPA: hypothetical protein GXZ90_06095 [Clostridiales bacterium]|nr:hypothetical protein [Clostridiales bacterium]